jgi:hypothetical protein
VIATEMNRTYLFTDVAVGERHSTDYFREPTAEQ